MRKLLMFLGVFAVTCSASEPAMLFDFSKDGHGWHGNPHTKDACQSTGFSVALTGEEDPWIEGPAVAVPGFGEAQKLALTLEAVSDTKGAFQLFYAPPGKGFTEDAAVRLNRMPGTSVYKGFIPAAGERLRFRIDPPGRTGRVIFYALRALPMVSLAAPAFEKPVAVALREDARRVAAGNVAVAHDPKRWNAFVCFVDGQKMAESNPSESLAYVAEKKVISIPFSSAETVSEKTEDGFAVRAMIRDEGGAVWQVSRRFVADKETVRIETSLKVSEPREVVHLPWLTLFAGVGSFGGHKTQALLPGVEYLEDEPSSNEKEIRGDAANRRIVDSYKVCYPMMALAAGGQWFSVAWQAGEIPVSPLFDSPDRVFHSGGHVLGLWSPAVGEARFESDFAVYGGIRLAANTAYVCSAALSGGNGRAVTEAVGAYVSRMGLPPLPNAAESFDDAVRLLASGWLDSAAHQGNQWRHAVWGTHFPPQPAEDPPAYLLWLAANASDATLKARLRDTARDVIASLPEGCLGINGVSHVKRPTGALLYGNLAGVVKQARTRAAQLARQLAQGAAHYRPASNKPDYASTLGSDTCNGFTALTAEEMLSDATFTGDETVIASALAVLDKITANYAGTVPRGAQPWEMPLHTPDIVASARLVRCYVLGYQLSGKTAYLEQARYWAWTGVTMVYLTPPTEGAVGLYATIGVIGATNWQAPNWIGQPVQWCGLVYRSALEDLARVDEVQCGTWQTLARGITIAGLQMCFPIGDPLQRGGLMPDYFLLKPQESEGPAINPGTLQAHLAEAYGKTPMYTLTRLANGSLLHVPGDVSQERMANGDIKLTIRAWPENEYRVLITREGFASGALVWNGRDVMPKRVEGDRALIATLNGSGVLLLRK